MILLKLMLVCVECCRGGCRGDDDGVDEVATVSGGSRGSSQSLAWLRRDRSREICRAANACRMIASLANQIHGRNTCLVGRSSARQLEVWDGNQHKCWLVARAVELERACFAVRSMS